MKKSKVENWTVDFNWFFPLLYWYDVKSWGLQEKRFYVRNHPDVVIDTKKQKKHEKIGFLHIKPKMLTKVANVYFSKHFFVDGLSKSSDHIVNGAVDLSFETHIVWGL